MKRIVAVLLSLFILMPHVVAMDELVLKTVVLDAGHGGKDTGAVSKDKKTLEKNLTLDITKRLERLIKEKYPDVKVVLTRSDDTYISLDDRGNIANKNKADLFISIHINSVWSTEPSGFSTHILGKSAQKDRDLYKMNLDLVKRENSVVMLDDNYNPKESGFDPSDPSSYIFMTMMQSSHLEQSIELAQIINRNLTGGPIRVNKGVSQDPFYVLWKTAMPSVLVELGFISNDKDLAELRKPSQREEIAKRLLKAFGEYKEAYDSSTSQTHAEVPVASASVPAEPMQSVMYGVQIFALSSSVKAGDPRLMGYSPRVFPAGKTSRYVVAISDSVDSARKELSAIRRKYPDAFIVRIEGDRLSRY